MEIGEDGVDQDEPQNKKKNDDDDGGGDALADTAGGGDAGVHQRGYAVGKAHDPQTIHARVDDRRLVGEQPQELPAEQQHSAAEQRAGEESVEQADIEALEDAVLVSRAPVPAGEAGAGGVVRRHHIEHQRVGIGGRRVAGNHDRVEGVDAHLHEQVGDGEDGVLQAGGDAHHQNALGSHLVDPQLPQIQTAGILPPQQVRHDQRRRYALGDGAGQCHAVRRHVQADDEEQVQRHVQRTGDGQIQQGALGVAGGAHHAVAAVVDGHGGHTEGEYLQVQHRAVHQLLLGVQHLQHLAGKQVAGQTHHDTEDGTDDEC